MLGRGSNTNKMGSLQAEVANNNHENTVKENTVCKNPKASRNDGDNARREVQPPNQSLHPPLGFSNAVTREDDEDEEDGDEEEKAEVEDEEEEEEEDADEEDKGDDNDNEDDHSNAAALGEAEDAEDEDKEDDDDANRDADGHDEAQAQEDGEEDTGATSSNTSNAETNTSPLEPPISNTRVTSDTEATDIPAEGLSEEVRGVTSTSLPPESHPRSGPAPATVQVENAFAVQVGIGNALCLAQPEESENAACASCGEACRPHIGTATVAVYINNCGAVQVGNHNRMVVGEVAPKVTPQENAFVKACCELDIDPKTADDIREKLSRADVLQQFAKKMETYQVTCRIRSATKGCILLELEVPTEADRLQLLRMARDGTFQQVLLETFLPELAAEGRAVNMNLAIGIRNPSQEILDELQGAVGSNSHENIKLIEIPNGVSPDTADAAEPDQPEPHPGQAESSDLSELSEDETGSVEESPDAGQSDVPDSPGAETNTPASNTDEISKLTSLLRLLSEPRDGEDETRQEETTVSAEDLVADMPIEESNANVQASEDNNDQRLETDSQPLETEDQPLETDSQPLETDSQPLETNVQRLEPDDQPLETDLQRPEPEEQPNDRISGYVSVTLTSDEAARAGLSAHPEVPPDVTTSKVFERSRSQETGDEETTKLLRHLAVTLDRREWKQVAQALRVRQPEKDLSAADTGLRMRILRDWQAGPAYGQLFDRLLLTLQECGRDDFAVELLQSAPQTFYTTSSGPPIRGVAETPSVVSTQVKGTSRQPKKPRKPPVDPRTPLRRMPYQLMKKIAMELDPPGPLANWKDLADCAGYSMQEIGVFGMEYMKPDGSPTCALLQAWGTRNATVQDLLNALRQTELLNVAEMLAPDDSDDEDV